MSTNIVVGDRVIIDPAYIRDAVDKEGRLRKLGLATVQEICVPEYYETWTTYYYMANDAGMVVCLGRRYIKKIRDSQGLFALDGIEEGLPGETGADSTEPMIAVIVP